MHPPALMRIAHPNSTHMHPSPNFTMRNLATIAAFGWLAGLLLLAGRSPAADVPPPPAKSIGFETHDGYFVSNQFEADAAVSFVVITDQPAFDLSLIHI